MVFFIWDRSWFLGWSFMGGFVEILGCFYFLGVWWRGWEASCLDWYSWQYYNKSIFYHLVNIVIQSKIYQSPTFLIIKNLKNLSNIRINNLIYLTQNLENSPLGQQAILRLRFLTWFQLIINYPINPLHFLIKKQNLFFYFLMLFQDLVNLLFLFLFYHHNHVCVVLSQLFYNRRIQSLTFNNNFLKFLTNSRTLLHIPFQFNLKRSNIFFNQTSSSADRYHSMLTMCFLLIHAVRTQNFSINLTI